MDYYLWDGYGAVEDLGEGDPLSYPQAVDALEAAGRSSGRDQTLWGRAEAGCPRLLAVFARGKGVVEIALAATAAVLVNSAGAPATEDWTCEAPK